MVFVPVEEASKWMPKSFPQGCTAAVVALWSPPMLSSETCCVVRPLVAWCHIPEPAGGQIRGACPLLKTPAWEADGVVAGLAAAMKML